MVVSSRNAPALFGSGRIDAIPERRDQGRGAAASPPEVAGRVSRLKDGRVGRFGWKAQVPGLEEFVLTACANEMGLEVTGHHQAPDPLGYGDDDDRPEPDMSDDECRALVTYVGALAAPVEWAGGEWLARGRTVFGRAGCADCHRPSLGGVNGIYSDLLVHDMGPGLNDAAVYYGRESEEENSPGVPKSPEWRTPPLWGVADSAPYLHDGRARTLAAAIQLHGGQAKASAARFAALAPAERSQLLDFLGSLRVRRAARHTYRDRLVAYEEYLPVEQGQTLPAPDAGDDLVKVPKPGAVGLGYFAGRYQERHGPIKGEVSLWERRGSVPEGGAFVPLMATNAPREGL